MALAAYCYAERRHQAWARDLAGEAAEGLRLASRAIELGKDDSNVLWMTAFAVRHLAMDAQRAKQLADRSLQLNPNSAIALAIAAWIEVGMGNYAKALELASRAERSKPARSAGVVHRNGRGIGALTTQGNSTRRKRTSSGRWCKIHASRPRFAYLGGESGPTGAHG